MECLSHRTGFHAQGEEAPGSTIREAMPAGALDIRGGADGVRERGPSAGVLRQVTGD